MITKEKKILAENLKKAVNGKKRYKELLRNFPDASMRKLNDFQTNILLFPSHEDEVNYYGLLYLEEYIFRNCIKNIIIITSDEKVHKAAENFQPELSQVVFVQDTDMEDILMFYRLYLFDNRIRIVSLDEPEGRNAVNLLHVKNITAELLVAVGVYFLIPYKKVLPERKKKYLREFEAGKQKHSGNMGRDL